MSPKVTMSYKEEKKDQILEAARKVFVRKGYEAATMQDIVEESGLSRGGVYLYFSSTEEIFLALLDISDGTYFSTIDHLMVQYSTVWEAVVQLVQMIRHELLTVGIGLAPAIYEYFLSVQRNALVRPLLLKRFDRALRNLTLLLEKGVSSGEFHPLIPPEDIAKFLILYMDGAAVNIIHLGGGTVGLHGQTDQILLYLAHVLQVKREEGINQTQGGMQE